MLRLIVALLVMMAFGLVGAVFDLEPGTWGGWALWVVGLFAVSAVLPHYMWRGEPLFPDRHKRR